MNPINLSLGIVANPILERALRITRQAQAALDEEAWVERVELQNYRYDDHKFGYQPFRELVSKWHGLNPDQSGQVFGTFSVRQGISLSLSIIRDNMSSDNHFQKQFVAVPSPAYSRHLDAIFESGFIPLPVPLTVEGFDLEVLRAVCEQGIGAFIFSRSHINPSGHSLTEENFQAIAEICSANGVLLIIDEVYDQFGYIGQPTSHLNVSLLQSQLQELQMAVLGGTSKTFRTYVSWVTCTKNLEQTFQLKVQALSAHGANLLAQQEFSWIYKQGIYEEFMSFLRQYNGERQSLLQAILQKSFAPLVPKIEGGYFIGLHLEMKDFPKFQQKLQQRGVIIQNNHNCYIAGNPGFTTNPQRAEFQAIAISNLTLQTAEHIKSAIRRAIKPPEDQQLIRFGVIHLEPEQIRLALQAFVDTYKSHMEI